MVEVAVKCGASGGGETVDGLGAATVEGLQAADVLGFLELARVGAQVAVADIEQGLELAEGKLVAYRERAHDPEPHPLVDEPVEAGVFRPLAAAGHDRGLYPLGSSGLRTGTGARFRGHVLSVRCRSRMPGAAGRSQRRV